MMEKVFSENGDFEATVTNAAQDKHDEKQVSYSENGDAEAARVTPEEWDECESKHPEESPKSYSENG